MRTTPELAWKWTATDWRSPSPYEQSPRRGRRQSARSSSRTPTCPTLVQDKNTSICRMHEGSSGHVPRRPRRWPGANWKNNARRATTRLPTARRPTMRSTRRAIRRLLAVTANGAEGQRRAGQGHPTSAGAGDACPCLRRGDRLREGPGRVGADHRPASAGGEGFIGCRSSAATCAARSSPPTRLRRCRAEQVRRHRREHDRPPEVRQRAAVQPASMACRGTWASRCRPRPSGTSWRRWLPILAPGLR